MTSHRAQPAMTRSGAGLPQVCPIHGPYDSRECSQKAAFPAVKPCAARDSNPEPAD